MSPNELKVLRFLVEEGHHEDHDFGYVPFAPICDATKLERNVVRRACRSLKRKGLTKFCSGLWTDDGEIAGSGYTATRAGVAVIESEDKEQAKAA